MDNVEEKLYTADDLWELSRDGKSRELDGGIIVEMAPTGGLHMFIAARLIRYIGAYVDDNKLGYTSASEGGFLLSADPVIVRAPDVGFISKARLKPPIPQKFVPLAPDLAVEVVSPGDLANQIAKKVNQFLAAGTRLVWVIYPEENIAYVYRVGKDIEVVSATGTLDGGDVLPGFKLPMQDIFRDLES